MGEAPVSVVGPKHELVQRYLAIQNNTRPNPQRLIVLDGLWELESAVAAGLPLVALLLCPQRFRGNRASDVARKAEALADAVLSIGPKLADRLSDRDTSDGLAAIAVSRQWTLADLDVHDPALVLVLDGLEVLGNVGTAVRSAQASGAAAVVLTNRRVRLTHPRLIHASMAASLTMPMVEASVSELAGWLAGNGFQTVLADTDAATTYKAFGYGRRVAVVLGSERYGIHRDWRAVPAEAVSIPMAGGVDSLNVANAATILLFEIASRQRPGDFGEAGESPNDARPLQV